MRFTATRVMIAVGAIAAAVVAGWVIKKRLEVKRISLINGAIIAQHQDPHWQRPIANAAITAASGESRGKAVSNEAGLFRLQLNPPVVVEEFIELKVATPGYQPLSINIPAGEQIQVIRLSPIPKPDQPPAPIRSETIISNIRVRYATRSVTTSVVGSAVRPFDIINTGNVPCGGKQPCSPDGKWRATIGSLSIDAGEQNRQFRNVRVSCIAGPCPFTAVESDRFSRGGKSITVSVRNWSDRVTYLLEAEVEQTVEAEAIRYTYPVIFGDAMNFTLPAVANGLSIEADVNQAPIVFPLGPELRLSWAACRSEGGADGPKRYRCELNPGYRLN